jgi:tetratricopeptide (TPR) repeat protein
MHVEFVKWADQVNAESDRGQEFEAILGYHLEQAYKYLGELGPIDEAGVAIGRDAAKRLGSAGRRALARGDMHAAANLLKRATALLAEDDPQRAELLPELAETLMGLGDFAEARAVVQESKAVADRLGKARIKGASQLIEIFIQMYSGDSGDERLPSASALIPQLEQEEAHNELAIAWRLIMLTHGMAGQYELAEEAAGKSVAYARLAGNERLVAKVGCGLAYNALYAPTPVTKAIEQCEQLIADGLSDRQAECNIMCVLAQLRAMNGELDVARTLYRSGRAILRDLGQGVFAASTGIDLARVELHGGDLALAEQEVRSDYEFLERMGETYFLSTIAALLARIVREQGRDEEALALSQVAERVTAEDDLESQALWRAVRAPIIGRSGDLELAEALARSAVELMRRTEAPMLQADALYELAEVLSLAGRVEEARDVVSDAIALYRAKGNVALEARCIAWLDQRQVG